MTSDAPAQVGTGNTTSSEPDIPPEKLLSEYIEGFTLGRFTDEASQYALSKTKDFVADLCRISRMRQRADRESEKTLRHHVEDSATFLQGNIARSKKEAIADWSKVAGFTFLGFTVQQVITIGHEKKPSSGSSFWLAFDIAITVALIMAGLMIDLLNPFKRLRSKSR
jgi:hypothetical protein